VLAGAGLLAGLAGCSDPAPDSPAAAPAAVVESAPDRVPSAPSSPSPRRASRPSSAPAAGSVSGAGSAPVAAAPRRAAEAASGNAGLDRFVAAVQRQLPAVAMDRRDEEVEDLGQQACDSLAAGQNLTTVAGEISQQGVADMDARKLVTLARTTACPPRPKD
jgi:predicted lipid-binding transport protein (Tim44 family)